MLAWAEKAFIKISSISTKIVENAPVPTGGGREDCGLSLDRVPSKQQGGIVVP